MSHLYNRSGVPAYGMDPERAYETPASEEKTRARGASTAPPRGRASSYAIVLLLGVVATLSFVAYGAPIIITAGLSARPCDCPPSAPLAHPLLGAAGAHAPPSAAAAAANDEREGARGAFESRKLADLPEADSHRRRVLKRKHAVREPADAAFEKPPPEKPPPLPPRAAFVVRPVQPSPPTSILITGAAGFIGSHFALLLMDRGGYKITAIDDMSRASWDTVLRLQALATTAAAGTDFQFVKQVRAWGAAG
jgi:hypothetical protein